MSGEGININGKGRKQSYGTWTKTGGGRACYVVRSDACVCSSRGEVGVWWGLKMGRMMSWSTRDVYQEDDKDF